MIYIYSIDFKSECNYFFIVANELSNNLVLIYG